MFLQLCKHLRLWDHPIVQKLVDPSLFIHRFTESKIFQLLLPPYLIHLLMCKKEIWIEVTNYVVNPIEVLELLNSVVHLHFIDGWLIFSVLLPIYVLKRLIVRSRSTARNLRKDKSLVWLILLCGWIVDWRFPFSMELKLLEAHSTYKFLTWLGVLAPFYQHPQRSNEWI